MPHWGHSVHVKLYLSSWGVVGKIDDRFLFHSIRRRWRSNGDPCRRQRGRFSMFDCRIEADDKVLVSRVQIGPVVGRSDPNEARLVQTHNRRKGWRFRFLRSFRGVGIVITVQCSFGFANVFIVVSFFCNPNQASCN